MTVTANNFPMPFVIKSQPQTANASVFDANFSAISGYLANVSNEAVAISSGSLSNGSAKFTLLSNGDVVSQGNINTTGIITTSQDTLTFDANGHSYTFDTVTYSTPTLIFPNQAALGDVDAQQAFEIYSSNALGYLAMNYNYDQYIWANTNSIFLATNWAANNYDGTLASNWMFDKLGNMTLPAFGGAIMANGNVNTVYIQANTNSGTWAFTNANTLIFPDSTGQSTAFTNLANLTIYNAYNRANAAYAAANNNIPDIFANSGLVLANSANLTFNNTASVNAVVTANGTVGANISFVVNTSMNLVTLNVSSNTLSVGTSSSAAANGYSRLTNGLLFQWGNVSVTNANTTVTFPVPFTSIFQVTATTVQGGVGATGANVNCAAFITTSNSTAFNVRTNSATANTVNWMAIGN